MRRLSIGRARRLALGAQEFADPRPAGRVDIRHLRRVVGRTGLLQIDSVSAVERAHYLPLYSRLGAYDRALLGDAAYRRRELFEYWVHEACYVPVELHPLLRHRMRGRPPGRRVRALMDAEPGYVDRVLAEVAERGPLEPADLTDAGSRQGPWWGWSKGKVALEHLFSRGLVTVADRRGFVRRYDLTERVLPAGILAAPTPTIGEAHRGLVLRAIRHLGVATVADLADYHRIRTAEVRAVLPALRAEGAVVDVAVDGWGAPAVMDPKVRVPRRIDVATVLAPFDPVVFHRPRAERLFDFTYRIEIYVPREQRRYGYYVLPLLVGDRIVGRADCRADRDAGWLRVQGIWWEDHADEARDAMPVARALGELAEWLGLAGVDVHDRGCAAPAVRRALATALR